MSTFTGSRDVFDRVGTTTGVTISTGEYTGTNSKVLTFATTSAQQRADHTFTYEVPYNPPIHSGTFNSVFGIFEQVLTNCTTGVSTTDWRAWCSKDATVQDTYYLTSYIPPSSGTFTYTRATRFTTAPWIYQSRVQQTITRSREFNYDFQMYSTTEDSLGNPTFNLWWVYPNSSTQTEVNGAGGDYLYYTALILEITSTQPARLTDTLTSEADGVPFYRTGTVWYTKSTRDLFGQSIDAGIGTSTKTYFVGASPLSNPGVQFNYSPEFITMGYGYTEWARSFSGYAPAGAGTRSSEYGELTSHAGVLDLWPFERWDTWWDSTTESYYLRPGVAMVAPGVIALPPWCGVSSMIDGVGSVSALVDGENISYTTASSTESSSGTVTFVTIESSSFTYKIEKMGAPVTYYQGNEGRLSPNNLGLGDNINFYNSGDIVETSTFYELTGTEILKNYFALNESLVLPKRATLTGGFSISNNPWYLYPRVVQAPAKHMIYPETIALWGCFDTATGSTPATTIYSEYTTFLKSAYSRFRPIVLASLA